MKHLQSGILWGMALIAIALSACATHQTVATQEGKQVITSAEQVPRHSYAVQPDVRKLLLDNDRSDRLMQALEKDLTADLGAYDIRDAATLQEYHKALAAIDFLRGNPAGVRAHVSRIRELEDKPGPRLTSGLITLALLDSCKSGHPDPKVFARRLGSLVEALPYQVVASQLKEGKSTAEILSRNLMYGIVDNTIKPAAKSGSISAKLAMKLVSYRWILRYYLPVKDEVARVYGKIIAAHTETRDDIWTGRMVNLNNRSDLHPVGMAVWDSGIDLSLFAAQLWINPGEVADNNLDDDGNGYIDDVHGIGFDLQARYSPALLMDMPMSTEELEKAKGYLKGYTDMQANVASLQAAMLRKHLSAIAPEDVKAFIEDLQRYAIFAHGTHVAGIAMKDNPAARLVTARLSFDHRIKKATPSIAQAHKDAAAMAATVAYFKAAGVRVVNISWGESLAAIEAALEINNAGGDAEARKALAKQILDIVRKGLYTAMEAAPDILFVVSAGNSDTNAAFDSIIPSSFRLANLVSVGAVNQSGDETGFTSFGPIDLYANGSEVASMVPGGDVLKLSGTSTSSPAVANLAAKLLAVRPDLTVAQLRRLILEGCDTVMVDRKKSIRLLNPRASFELIATAP